MLKLVSFVLLATLISCGATEPLEDPARAVPEAEGKITTKPDRHGNTKLDIHVDHLARPDQVVPGATNYVVWILPLGGESYQNIGPLNLNADREADYETKIPYSEFDLIITPEPTSAAVRPTGPTVLEKSIQL